MNTPSAAYYKTLVRKTRTFGSCYLHVGTPCVFDDGDIRYTVTSYGRSEHKSKAYATRNGKPVSSKSLFGVSDLRNR